MKILVTGVNGQLGYDILRILKNRGYNDILAVDKDEMDITNETDVKQTITAYNPNVVMHCAAWTAVDPAEDNKELCAEVNVNGTRYIANACKEVDAKMIYISTDYVFNGEGSKEFTVEDRPDPINTYGETKYLGEEEVKKLIDRHFIVRISWVFGINGNNFIKTMIKLGESRDELDVVNDQIGSPTYTYDLAKLLCDMMVTEEFGTYQATNEGLCSWYDFACEIFEQANIDVKVNPVTSDKFPTKAKRPKNSRLSKDSLSKHGFDRLPTWQNALSRFLDELNNN
ncbi:dTDP-4-dehydrorhamnose reductase [Haloplasma contractile]|uniref:dTDP-4-dehydrorhamnose reductase n=1 Tax=Haloplasma contractile SSD-17B TaxID=1033810 RepID=U2DR60_9MOLU|nr:dTDP-4-dehydrorhamnose reductase [Haloplasma contractile]ERJ11057.1 dTDP-L-rhamnose synthase protein [Haloplasma contractile SSD-17B]